MSDTITNATKQTTTTLSNSSLEQAFLEATGPIAYNMTNDYMFRAILQSNEKVLRKLVCALLHYKPEMIKSIDIKNPILLGDALTTKDFVLDINILLNSNTFVNLEMQVNNLGNWPERSLSYLCRNFDNLNQGDDYITVKPAIHIGILDFIAFSDVEPEFYATYRMLNEKNHHLYSDKFTLRVLSLNCIEHATAEDKDWKIDHWAQIFKVRTWEELKMLANQEPDFIELSREMFKQNADETIRQQCRAREAAAARERARDKKIANLTEELDEAHSQVETLSSENEILKRLLEEHNIPIPD